MGIDKIPLDKFKEGEDGSFGWLDKDGNPLLIMTRAEYANAEKINQIIDDIRDMQSRLIKVEGK